MKKIDKNYFPGWVRKSISFTIDDGNLTMDKKFIDIVKPYGIKGTFNLSNFFFDRLSPEGYREFYRGFEIANHVRLHPLALVDGVEYEIKDYPHPEHAESENAIYKTNEKGLYELESPKNWRKIADVENYLRLTHECTEEIRRVFPEQKKLSFVWPYCMQKSAELFEALKKEDFYAIRKTGSLLDKTGFSLPEDRTQWSYNASHSQLLEVARLYREYADDGELKTFIFGVHSVDFERSENWCDLEAFAKEYGARPEEFFYATVGEILDYEDAIKEIKVTDTAVENPTDLTLYIKVDGERLILAPHSSVNI